MLPLLRIFRCWKDPLEQGQDQKDSRRQRLLHDHSSPSPFHSIAQALKLSNDPIPMVALNLDTPIFDGSSGAEAGFQFGGEFGESACIQRKVGDDRHPLASSALLEFVIFGTPPMSEAEERLRSLAIGTID